MSGPPSHRARATLGSWVDRIGIPRYWLKSSAAEISMIASRCFSHFPAQCQRRLDVINSSPARVSFGCGDQRRDGWSGIDRLGTGADLILDLRRPLPFPTASIDLCHSEHFLEHLFPDEGERHLHEVCRVLKPGGRYRVAVPDFRRFVSHYLAKDDAFFELAFPWPDSHLEAVYCIANWGGEHRNIFDVERLSTMATTAGFSEVTESAANASSLPELQIDISSPQRIAETLYLELIKR